jgi:hypothetical protein
MKISLSSPKLSDAKLYELTWSIRADLSSEAALDVDIEERESVSGSKGMELVLGTIVLSFLTSGSAVAMFNVFKSYFDRDSSLEIELEGSDGRRFKINAQNMRQSQISRTLERVQELLGGTQ